MKIEVYYFKEKTLDPWCCRVVEVEMTEKEFEEKVERLCSYDERDDMYLSNDGTVGYYVLEW